MERRRAVGKTDVDTERLSPTEPGGTRQRPRWRWITALVVAVILVGAAAIALHRQASRPAGPVSGPVHRSASATATHTSPGPGLPGSWHLALADDFSGAALDSSRWVTCYDWNLGGCTNATNHELEWYTPGQVTVADGAVTLTAQRRPTSDGSGKTYAWTSGMLSTGRPSWNEKPRFTFKYGYLEASIKMPSAAGMFPAFWLLAADKSGYPEVDVVEMIGNHTSPFMNLHWITASGISAQAPFTLGSTDYSAGYHTFAVDWEPGNLTWYVDGVASYKIADSPSVPAIPMEIIFTLAVGFPDPPPADVSTGSMSIERVRLWQH